MSQEAGKNSQTAKGRDCLNEGRRKVKTAILKRIEALGEPSKKKHKTYLYTGAATLLMLSILFLGLRLYPFGDNTLVYSDGDQYLSFAGYLQNCLFTNDNLLYSWSNVLGGNMLGTFAYYCASPFNLLLILFPMNLLLGYHVIFCVKVILAALFFAAMLNSVWEGADEKAVVLFSASYPFMGYMAAYAWNQSWMDGILCLPVLLTGIISIVRRQKAVLYVVALSLMLLSNYYVGYMVCIASVILFVSACCLECRVLDRKFMKTTALYVGGSMLAAALAAILLLPTYFALPKGRSLTVSELASRMGYYRCMPGDILSMLYGNGHDFGAGNSPFIYVGILQLVLIVLFFLNRRIDGRLKAVSGMVILVFAVSFSNTALDIAWHGMSSNAWFNHRYSFILSFVLELIAYYSFKHVQGARGQFLLAGACLAGLTAFMVSAQRKTNVGASVLLMDIAIALVALFLLSVYVKPQKQAGRARGTCFALLMMVTLGSLLVNCALSMRERVRNRSADLYKEASGKEAIVREAIAEPGDEFYRRASVKPYGRCDAMLFGFSGVQNYASTEDAQILNLLKRLGIEHTWMWGDYNDNVPLSTDTLLGIRYILSEPSYKQGHYTLLEQISGQEQEGCILKNEDALPLIFPVEQESHSVEGEDIFSLLNRFWNSITETGGEIFNKVPYEKVVVQKDSGKEIQVHFTAVDSNPVYAYIPGGEGISVEGISEGTDPSYSANQDIVYVGTFVEGERVEMVIHVPDSYEKDADIVIGTEDTEILFLKAENILQRDIHVEKESSSHLSMSYHAEKDEILSSTIPYDVSWHVAIDGEEVPARRNMDSFLAFDCPEGSHEIELVYWPKGFRLGCGVSGGALMLSVGILLCSRKRKLRNAML